jgi:hypothetical protein
MSYTVDNKVYKPLGDVGNVKPTNEKDTVYIGTNAVYARHVEYLSKNGSQGFMLRAYNQTKRVADTIFKQVLGKGIR